MFSSSGDFSGRPTEMRRYAARRWQRAVQANFHSATQLARAFSVDVSTAENWMAGANAPSLWAVLYANENDALRPVVRSLFEGAK